MVEEIAARYPRTVQYVLSAFNTHKATVDQAEFFLCGLCLLRPTSFIHHVEFELTHGTDGIPHVVELDKAIANVFKPRKIVL